MYQRYLAIMTEWSPVDLDTFRRMVYIERCTKKQITTHYKSHSLSDVETIYTLFYRGYKPDVRGTWNKSTDDLLTKAMQKWGPLKQVVKRFWHLIASCVPNMCAKQCRERWNNQLDPQLDKSEWTKEDETRLLAYVEQYGHRWAVIQKEHYPKRSPNYLKNQFYRFSRQLLKKKTKRKIYKSDPEDSDNEALSNEYLSSEEEDSYSQSDSQSSSPRSVVSERKYATRSTSNIDMGTRYRAPIHSGTPPENASIASQKRKLCVSLVEDDRPQKRQRMTIDDPMFYIIVTDELQNMASSFRNIALDIGNSHHPNCIDLTAY